MKFLMCCAVMLSMLMCSNAKACTKASVEAPAKVLYVYCGPTARQNRRAARKLRRADRKLERVNRLQSNASALLSNGYGCVVCE